jgi:uncharacterized membrane protein YraQ (UPF0718 family)
MKQEFEKFIIWYLPFCILTAIITGLILPYFIENVEKFSKSPKMWLVFLSIIGSNLHKWVAAVWLLNQNMRKRNGRYILWALFGFFQGMWAVAFYVGLSIFEEIKCKPKTNISPIEQSEANKSVFTTP